MSPSGGPPCSLSSALALLGVSIGSSGHVCHPELLHLPLPHGGYLCFPSEEGQVQGQPEEADDLLVPRCGGDGLQRVGRAATSSLLSFPRVWQGRVRQCLFYTGQ